LKALSNTKTRQIIDLAFKNEKIKTKSKFWLLAALKGFG